MIFNNDKKLKILSFNDLTIYIYYTKYYDD